MKKIILYLSIGCGAFIGLCALCCVGILIGTELGIFPDVRATNTAEAIAANQTAAILALTPSDTPTPTDTSTPTETPTQTLTPTITYTPSRTFTPSDTPPPSDTPTPSDTPSNTPIPSETSTPLPTNTRRPTEAAARSIESDTELNIIENVNVRGGISVYPLPDTSSGRLFAAVSNFKPHVAGRNDDGTWLYILYFQGPLRGGWAARSNLALTDDEIEDLTIINPNNPPALPDLVFNQDAARPFGANPNAAAPAQPTQPPLPPAQATPASGNQPPPPVIQPTQPPAVQPAQPPGGRPGNCSTAVAMGLSPQQAAQWSHLDRDKDGVACYGD